MSQASGEKSDQSATARAEELLDSVGRRIGLFAALAGQRLQDTATYVREEAGRINQPGTSQPEGANQQGVMPAGEKGQLAMQRSEEAVDRMLQRLSSYASIAAFQTQKAAARLREEAEDMWAEAQHIRQENSRKPQ